MDIQRNPKGTSSIVQILTFELWKQTMLRFIEEQEMCVSVATTPEFEEMNDNSFYLINN